MLISVETNKSAGSCQKFGTFDLKYFVANTFLSYKIDDNFVPDRYITCSEQENCSRLLKLGKKLIRFYGVYQWNRLLQKVLYNIMGVLFIKSCPKN
jgi:hypothetical protein